MIIDEEDYIAHYGTLRKSGRYPWGSGGDQNTRNKMFLDYVEEMRTQGLKDTDIAKGVGMSTTDLRELRTIANNEEKQSKILRIERMAEHGMSNVEIGKRMGIPESSVRALRAPGVKERAMELRNTADMLKEEVAKKKFVDVGSGVENYLNVTETKMKVALRMLQEEGYEVHKVKGQQVGTGLDTEYKVLAPPGTTQKEIWMNLGDLKQITNHTDDNGLTWTGTLPPISVHPDRVAIKYGEDGGDKADGVLLLRPGVKDLDLGGARYAQVRVAVGDGHYLKGMAMYNDDLPKGVDILFNTAKTRADAPTKLDALKKVSGDPTNPFSAVIRRQIGDTDPTTGKLLKVTSAMNIVNEEGDWTKWSKSIASQVLSKQTPKFAKNRLDESYISRKEEFDSIMKLTNPTVRKHLLQEFADSAEKASVHLKAAGIPRMGWHAILPINSLPPTQIYAPNFRDGERVVLIRYPHGGTFEIPELTVNNKHPEAIRLLGRNPKDAVGIHVSVAERLSGADFDGDTVLVVPNNNPNHKFTTAPALEGLKDFNPRVAYKGYPGMKTMTNTQTEMGKISNLITDMTIKGAPNEHLARAIRHSMVVIDAEKHGLNYKESARVNNIKQLKEKYQGGEDGKQGAATLISRAKAKTYIPERKDRLQKHGGPIDPNTGQKIYEPTNKINYKTGQPKLMEVTKLSETANAHELSSGTRIESLYADHSNRLKALANQARLELVNTPPLKYSPSAKKVYAPEVKSLNAKLFNAVSNRPLERQAQVIANSVVKAQRAADPNMDKVTLRKVNFQALEGARARVGAHAQKITITQREWDAIQAGAISDSKLSAILSKADLKVVREHATPRYKGVMTPSNVQRAQSMFNAGHTRAEVAAALGVSLTTLDTHVTQ